MSRLVPVLSLGCLVGIGWTAYSMLSGGGTGALPAPPVAALPTAAAAPAAAEDQLLQQARHACTIEALDAAVQKLRDKAADLPKDRAAWRRLADALLQRVLQRNLLLGLRVGEPLHAELPAATAADLDAADDALAHARALGDDSAEAHMISAEVMSQRITGLTAALQWNGKIEEELAKAGERAEGAARLHLALGLRKLMAPAFLGHDPQAALGHFDFAAKADQVDERPALFAAMASYLQKKRLDAIAWLERAVARNPNNTFAKVVLARVQRGEDDPFGRDVTAVEAAAAAPK
ncbi:MAG: hypothetical protein U1E73_03135 [Planctomycetota bacterium]